MKSVNMVVSPPTLGSPPIFLPASLSFFQLLNIPCYFAIELSNICHSPMQIKKSLPTFLPLSLSLPSVSHTTHFSFPSLPRQSPSDLSLHLLREASLFCYHEPLIPSTYHCYNFTIILSLFH